jgi:Fe-Mn family superoxide dismutase
MKNSKEIKSIVQRSIQESLRKTGKLPHLNEKPKVTTPAEPVNEALHVVPNNFVVKTEKLSKTTKEAHESLYKKYTESFNKISSELDAVNKHEAGSFASKFRSFKMDEAYNLNAVKLHELYFNNISDLASEIGIDSVPYIKLSRDYGNFENWQFDFMACAMSAREGWAMTVYEPYKNTYMNICIDGHTQGVPVGTVPVLVLDMWSHSFYKDYDVDKRSYLVAMMREINWNVIEARMALVEKSELSALYFIRPVYNDEPNKLLGAAEDATNPPIDSVNGGPQDPSQMPPSTPAAPERTLNETTTTRVKNKNED